MLFNTKTYVVFFALVVLLHPRFSHRGKLWFLLGASALFYGWGQPSILGLLTVTIVGNWWAAIRIAATDRPAARRAWLAVTLGLDLGLLCYFKYGNFAIDVGNDLFVMLGRAPTLGGSGWDIAFPIGISFYTFQIVSYVIDVYRRDFPAHRSLRDVALYMLFFPQLVAGPVERASHLLPQYAVETQISARQVREGFFLILMGFVKKTVLADRLGDAIAPYFGKTMHEPGLAWASLLLFTLQIYVDFSAYSDIAIGTGRLLGFDIRPNFDLPFVVPSIPERWRRWHMSMGTWFRDYVFIPLGGSRGGYWRTQLNILLVMLLSGLWHGASYNFIVWGLLNGLSMVLHSFAAPIRVPVARLFSRSPISHWSYFYACCVATTLTVSFINIFFRSDSFPIALSFVNATLHTTPWGVWAWLAKGALPDRYGLGFVFFAFVWLAHEGQRWFNLYERIITHAAAWWAACVGMFVAVLLFGVKGTTFIYYAF